MTILYSLKPDGVEPIRCLLVCHCMTLVKHGDSKQGFYGFRPRQCFEVLREVKTSYLTTKLERGSLPGSRLFPLESLLTALQFFLQKKNVLLGISEEHEIKSNMKEQ